LVHPIPEYGVDYLFQDIFPEPVGTSAGVKAVFGSLASRFCASTPACRWLAISPLTRNTASNACDASRHRGSLTRIQDRQAKSPPAPPIQKLHRAKRARLVVIDLFAASLI
jgi:hypothetical protein